MCFIKIITKPIISMNCTIKCDQLILLDYRISTELMYNSSDSWIGCGKERKFRFCRLILFIVNVLVEYGHEKDGKLFQYMFGFYKIQITN